MGPIRKTESQHDLIWELPSNDGWHRVACYFKDRVDDDRLVVNLDCRGEFWDRSCYFRDEGYKNAKLVDDFRIELPQVVVPKRQLIALQQMLESWLDAPQEVSVDLGTEHVALRLNLQPQRDTISSMEKPVCSLAYESRRLQVSNRFVVDQSCIRIQLTQLSHWLRENSN